MIIYIFHTINNLKDLIWLNPIHNYNLIYSYHLLDAPEAGRHNPSGTSTGLEEKLYVNQQSCVP